MKEDEAKDFAQEIGATFKLTSAYMNNGINELFKELGLRYLKVKYPDHTTKNAQSEDNKKNQLKLDKHNVKKKEGGCC